MTGWREIWCADFEFRAPEGQRPEPICLVAKELRSRKVVRWWMDELQARSRPPYPVAEDSLVVVFYGSAEWGCHRALGWPMPSRVLDLYAEFRNQTNGLNLHAGSGLVGALHYYGEDPVNGARKESMRELAMRGGPYTAQERANLLDYCESDVDATAALLTAMVDAGHIDTPRALWRGRYSIALAEMEWTGIPMDTGLLRIVEDMLPSARLSLIQELDEHHLYVDGTFKMERFVAWIDSLGARDWPLTDTGLPCVDNATLRGMEARFPSIRSFRELRGLVSKLSHSRLPVGDDGRNRTILSGFRSMTGRNQPRSSQFIFGRPSWQRHLIQAPAGRALAYVDYAQQEFGIAAALSQDPAMMAAYRSGDPYLEFARQAGAVPKDATSSSHPRERRLYKTCALGTLYAMRAGGLSVRTGLSNIEAHGLLQKHRRTYPTFWRWSDGAVDHARLNGSIHTVFGWTLRIGGGKRETTLRNFPMQANGAEMLRLACCLATEAGVQVAAPVHDALLVEAPIEQLAETVATTRDAMRDASRAVLGGFTIRTDCRTMVHPRRFDNGEESKIWDVLEPALPRA